MRQEKGYEVMAAHSTGIRKYGARRWVQILGATIRMLNKDDGKEAVVKVGNEIIKLASRLPEKP